MVKLLLKPSQWMLFRGRGGLDPRLARAFGQPYRPLLPHTLVRTQSTARRHYWTTISDARNYWKRKTTAVKAWAVVAAYLSCVLILIPAKFIAAVKALPPEYIESRRWEDLLEVTSEETVHIRQIASPPVHRHYQSLVHKDEIRILVLHPGEFEDDIRFHMEHVSLRNDDRKYEALSYTWGSNTRTHVIHATEGTEFLVTANLHSALKHLRNVERPRTLWIDALCINQSDLNERSQQVRLMGDVFAKSARVVVWLGESCPESFRAFKALEEIYKNAWQLNQAQVTWSKGNGEGLLRKKFVARSVIESILRRYLQEINLDPGTESKLDARVDIKNIDWVSVQTLLRRPWFHRLWVIQEVSHAKRAIVLCGTDVISWNTLAESLIYLVDNDLTKYLDPVCDLACNSVASIQNMRLRRFRDPLFTVVLDYTHGGCQDPRDKIFAMLSISEGRDKFDWEISFDYTLSVEELYKRFAIWDVLRNGTMRVLSCATTKDLDTLTALPSWVPDWTKILDRHLLVRANSTSKFSAGLGRDIDIWFTHDKSLLHIEGTIIDNIHVTGSEPRNLKTTSLFEIDDSTIQQFVATKEWLSECWEIAKEGRSMTRTKYDDFWRTMLCGLDSSGRPAPNTYAKHFLTYLKFMREAPETFRAVLDDPVPVVPYGLTVMGKLLTQALSLGFLSSSLTPDSWEFHKWSSEHLQTNTLIENSLQKWGKSKRFCRTREGRLARVPNDAVENDSICILHGSTVPYVLRLQEDGTYTVIGECYVHGVMHGEALSLPTYQPQILRLR